jgi:hypothetical protein
MSDQPPDSDGSLASPFSTGGGGVTFEHLVGASYLVSLLAEDVPRGLNRGIAEAVAFQQRRSGAVLDDILVTSRTADGDQVRLALAVKHSLTFSDAPSNTVFREVVSDCWDTFAGAHNWPFDPAVDRIGIGVGEYSATADKHFQRVLDWARSSDSPEVFARIHIEGFSSAEMRGHLQAIKLLLADAAGREVSEDEQWQFLRCLVVIHFDVEHAGSRDSTAAWNRLLDQMSDRDDAKARQLFDRLVSLVDEHAASGGTLTAESLRLALGGDFPLRDRVSCARDLERIREHSDRTLGRVTKTIGGNLHLPRAELLDQALDAIRANRFVVLAGEPGVGKSVLLASLADRLRQEGELFATTVDDLSEESLEAFASHLRLQNDLQALLGAISWPPLRCLFVDRLERASLDPDRRRVLNDLIREVKQYNEKVISAGGHTDGHWRIVAGCRLGELASLLPHLSLREEMQKGLLHTLQVNGLSDAELTQVGEFIPRLRFLIAQEHIQELLRRPFVLDFLTLPELTFTSENLPQVLTEAWLLDLYWHQVIRLADGARDGIGDPNARERAMLQLGRHALETGRAGIGIEQLEAQAVTGLEIDRVVERADARILFAHDVLQDWAAAKILESEGEGLPQFLKSCDESLALVRPLRLLALRRLEEERSPDNWLQLLSMFRGREDLSPRWYQLVLTAPLFSPLLDDVLEIIEPELLCEDGALLSEMLKAIRTVSTLPNPAIPELLAGAPQSVLDKSLAYSRLPAVEQWLPILNLVLKHKDGLPDGCMRELAEVCSMWMRQLDAPIRHEIGQMCLDFLTNGRGTAGLFKSAALWAADCLPERVRDFVYGALAGNDPDLRELLLHDDSVDWVPLCRYLPDVLVDATQRLLCQPRRADLFGGLDQYWCWTKGIHNDHGWRLPPTYLKGPFLGLLRLFPERGIELVARIVDHSTGVWRECVEREESRTPLPQTVRLSHGDHQIWGDEGVYAWFRYPSLGAHGATCALMALEHWMDEQISRGEDATALFERVLLSSSSTAMAGVCIAVALADWQSRAEAAIPLLEQPAFWFMDRSRAVQELGAAPFLDAFAAFAAQGDLSIAKRMASAQYRGLTIDYLAQAILFGASNQARAGLEIATKAFPENPPVFFEDEQDNTALMAKRLQACEMIAAVGDLANYEAVPGEEEDTFIVEFKAPKELEAKLQESQRGLDEQGGLLRLFGWSSEVLKEGQSGSLSLEEAYQLGQQFVLEDNPGIAPMSYPERLRAQAIALTAAALVEHNLDWARANDCLPWCREQLLIAARRPQASDAGDIPMSGYPWGCRRSAARALPILLRETPHDTDIRGAILHLCVYPEYEVRVLLLGALRVLWSTDSDFVWRCARLAVRMAIRAPSASRSTVGQRLKHRLWSLVYRIQAVTGPSVPRMLTAIPVLQIDWYALACVLYSLPIGNSDSPLEVSRKHLALMDDMLALTVQLYKLSQETYRDHRVQWVPVPAEWRWPLFDLASNWVMYLPLEQAQRHLLRPVLFSWEKAFGLAEDFLRQLLLSGSTPELHSRLLQVWRTLIPYMLDSPTCQNLPHRLSRELENTLGLMILHDPTGVVEWQVQSWEPILELVDLIDLWVETVGHHERCFPSLVGLLRSIGGPLMSEHGVKWLSRCMEIADTPDALLHETGVSSSLATALHDAWYVQGDSLRANHTRWHQFVVLVDHLAARGEQVAVELQRRIQTIRNE